MSDRGINKVVKIVAVLVLLPLGIIIPTLSLESYYAPTISAQTSTKSFTERKKEYRAQLKEALDTGEEERIKLRCLAVQANVKTLATKVAEVQTRRSTAYTAILDNVKNLETRLQAQAFDTTKLAKTSAELKDKTGNFEATLADYKVNLEDLTSIDCSQDPSSFKAALEAARSTHTKLIGQVADIRAYILNSLKPTMQQVREELIEQQAAGETQ